MIPQTAPRDLIEHTVSYEDISGMKIRIDYGKFLRKTYLRGTPRERIVSGIRIVTSEDGVAENEDVLCEFWADEYPILEGDSQGVTEMMEGLRRDLTPFEDLESEIEQSFS
ncbi:MAG: hypothetical protein WC796_06330 [Candidatus Pacearchaeota archaeon]|jgi:hypothetical protein